VGMKGAAAPREWDDTEVIPPEFERCDATVCFLFQFGAEGFFQGGWAGAVEAGWQKWVRQPKGRDS